jgi:hypothetical protein
MIHSDDAFLTSAQLAQRWHLRPQTLANWRSLGKGPPFIRMGRIGSGVLYPIEAVLAFEKLAPEWLTYVTRKPKP